MGRWASTLRAIMEPPMAHRIESSHGPEVRLKK